ncbi:uncharacterized protein I206_101311 [Kwoniella pini CBS 10737]|uniref:Uncharacterized protein n=1 Tax=Kwoniella pini CBS 10737 TaxID=1296096 RepID=A0A1B9IBC1_9TREE|nr:uncharacterized protein I206_00013 [Kwoniella pini CBS 10737]OCF52717.1 hypothetical protein I206_00013 [Kwoniella pini CBS 10737]
MLFGNSLPAFGSFASRFGPSPSAPSAFARFNPEATSSYIPQYVGGNQPYFGNSYSTQQPFSSPQSTPHFWQSSYNFQNPFNNQYTPNQDFSSFQSHYNPAQPPRGPPGQSSSYYDLNQNFGDDSSEEDEDDSESDDEPIMYTPQTTADTIPQNTMPDTNVNSAHTLPTGPTLISNPYWTPNSGWKESAVQGSASEYCQSAYDTEESGSERYAKSRKDATDRVNEHIDELTENIARLQSSFTSIVSKMEDRATKDPELQKECIDTLLRFKSAHETAKQFQSDTKTALAQSQAEIEALRNMLSLKDAISNIKSSEYITVGDARAAYKTYGSKLKSGVNGEKSRSPFESYFMGNFNNARNEERIPFYTNASSSSTTGQTRAQQTNNGTQQPSFGGNSSAGGPDINNIFSRSNTSTYNPWGSNPSWAQGANPGQFGYGYGGFGTDQYSSPFVPQSSGFSFPFGPQSSSFASPFASAQPQRSQLDDFISSLLRGNSNLAQGANTTLPGLNAQYVPRPQPQQTTASSFGTAPGSTTGTGRYSGGTWGRPGDDAYTTGLRPPT